MVLSDISIKRPVFATVLSLLIVVFGLAALLDLPVREYPDIDPPEVSIATNYTGAAAEVVDSQITQVIEGAISGIEGIRSIESSTEQGNPAPVSNSTSPAMSTLPPMTCAMRFPGSLTSCRKRRTPRWSRRRIPMPGR